MQRAIITVKGRVQRVGYRDFVAEIADKMGITGSVQNLPDGKNVEIMAEAEKKVLEEFLKLLWAKEDRIIKVLKIDVQYQVPKHDHEYFEIIYDDFQKEGFERIGDAVVFLKKIHNVQVEMLGKQDQMLGKQDQMLGKQDQMLGKQDQMLGKQDQILDKQDIMVEKLDHTGKEIVNEIRDLRGDLKSYMDRRFLRIEDEISEIRMKIGMSH
ncbi:MAG: acylphosphatase [Candidatus Methanoperedens sp.]|nr:acylphosphatase [Candidatus Methanoperedens sp.]